MKALEDGVSLETLKAQLSLLRTYPNLPINAKGHKWVDFFNRATLNPTNAFALYVATVTGAGTISITGKTDLVLQPTTTAGNDCSVYPSECSPSFSLIDPLIQVKKVRFSFIYTVGSNSSIEAFLGIIVGAQSLPLTAMPSGSVIHAGIYIDASADTNFRTSRNPLFTQTFEDTGEALDASAHKLEIELDTDGNLDIKHYQSSSDTSPLYTTSVTGFNVVNLTFVPFMFVQLESTTTKNLTVHTFGWEILA